LLKLVNNPKNRWYNLKFNYKKTLFTSKGVFIFKNFLENFIFIGNNII
jgi:hypothetical protein